MTTPSSDAVRSAAERAKRFMQALMDILDPAYDEETGRCMTYHFKIDCMEAESVFHDLRESLKPASLSAPAAGVEPVAWREAIEDALGVEADPANHTPEWARKIVREIREIGNTHPPAPAATKEEK